MKAAFVTIVHPSHGQRAFMFVLATAGFFILYAAARQFAGNLGALGLSDDAIRNLAHFTVYGTLALLMSKALFNQYLLCWMVSLLAAGAEEIHQLFVPFRFACVQDWLINVAGITTFLMAAWLIGRNRFSSCSCS